MKRQWILLALALTLAGCSHSDTFTASVAPLGPISTGDDIQLTVNSDQDYWPTWTADGRGILYAFVNPVAPGVPATRHRCMGILPAAGGTRLWQWCDNRFVRTDTLSSFTAYALNSDGRLLYAEALAPANPPAAASFPHSITLWIADTAHPLQRTALLTLPDALPGITWLADLEWTGPASFIALGQVFGSFPHCGACFNEDSLFADVPGIVVTGTIVGNHATLQPVTGTTGATGYSLAQGGTSIAFIRRGDPSMYLVPVTGGTAVAIPTGAGQQLAGITCKASNCVIADDPLVLSTGDFGAPIFASAGPGTRELRSVPLDGGPSQLLHLFGTTQVDPIVSLPRISPTAGDIVVQIGGTFGHLQTNSDGGVSDLHLLLAIVP
ncbi:MAG: hypothetical protein ACREK8_05060 [Gemmatimonadales bacterium]